ncbi:putative inositol polyphosphate phosphatase [Aspergillus clavatus NRRL 1]|uniref:Inositol polyphosphate phosphatase, putative n=1 Tax=Aspergillus clavatus (strain ATCC 1007 / CBS 513.65 / DSM 816 / NCTC 3887 / NRRL 1 / QM 1276 / 107) TaxID=344612 RepID=A1C5D2_ASPCL|nr:inositol polyphosphate phosphatase, putative [Aspergillus clavatus NRRL 1]EAW14900.1 inositol polyphosphate phosphatase, putative [Aspergillus clavatus NRRL 1]
MEGNGKDKQSTDNAPIRPVSSLLSHFENLSHRRSPSTFTNGPRDSTVFLRTPDPVDDARSSRVSLDLHRPSSPWLPTANSQSTPRYDHANGLLPRRGSPGRSPGSRQNRPMSMNFHSSPQLAPTLTVDSPRSPPRGFGSAEQHDHVLDTRTSRSPPNPSRGSLPPPANRPTTPNFSTSQQRPGHLSPAHSPSGGYVRDSSLDRKPKSASLPPPANRADKPKVPAKPAALTTHDGATLAPRPERTAEEDRISPFSTPPSSPEKSPPKFSSASRPLLPRSPSRRETEPPSRMSFDERSPAPTAHALRDARELGFSRRQPIPEPTRDTKPLVVQIPSHPVKQSEPLSAAPLSAHRLHSIDTPTERPNLPPRHPSVVRRGGVSPARPSPHLDSAANAAPTSRPQSFQVPQKDAHTPTQIQRQPSFPRELKLPQGPPVPERHISRAEMTEEEPVEEPTISRTDYPDASQANRRPPLLRDGPREIHTRYDTRLMDVCGKYVCTTGYLTRVWDLTTGEQIMSLSHGETVKSLSIAFKPGTGLDDEGQRLWLGMSTGEIHEVDISTRSLIATRSYPSRREVIKILRHKKEMWTLDDEGRLLVWPPDESGAPNLQYSYHNPYDRVTRGHTFSMVIGDTLWLATGKEVQVYRPNAHDDVSFKVLKKPLGSQHTGDVTSGAYTTKDGGRVYLGHADGKVTVYSPTDYTCLAVVNVSVYKINCLGVVGDYLWAAYKTGMIYVYDTRTNPWLVKKDWRAHESPVSSFLLDTSSVWTMNRLQVTSLGDDNCIRLWDGMLEDDWLELRMQSRDVEFCKFREISAVVMTWNAGASTPGTVRSSTFIQDAIRPENPPEILIFGFQELVDLENKKITAKSLLLGSKKKESGEKEHMSRQYRVWMEHLTRCINDCMPLDESYVLLHSANLIGLFTCVFVKHKERQRIKNVGAAEVKRGMGGLHGNKGALILRFVLDDSSFCLVNCHLAAGQTQTAHRNNDIAAILESESLPAESSLTTRANHFVSGGDGSMIMDHEICILNGDLNYRIDSIPRNVIIEDIRNNNLAKLLDRDQLLASRRKNPGFRLRSFTEAPITFAPTYKYDVGTDEYDTSEKKRSPAWCDRILYRGLGRIKQLDYRRLEVRASDHRPVSASFKLRVKTVLPQERATAWEACQQEFQKEKRRLASEASIEYLISVLGTDPQQARSLILGTPAQ